MRTVRWMVSGLIVAAMFPAAAAAQAGRPFKDAWFWGVTGGGYTFSTVSEQNLWAPSIGAEWLITRTRGGLYLSAEQAFFDKTSAVSDASGTPALVNIHDLRRFSAALLAFPVTYGRLRPYAGVGMSLNLIRRASLVAPPADPAEADALQQRVDDQKDRAAFIGLAGAQVQFTHFSLFGQATWMPAQQRFLFNGRATYILQAGIRFNVGSSIDQVR